MRLIFQISIIQVGFHSLYNLIFHNHSNLIFYVDNDVVILSNSDDLHRGDTQKTASKGEIKQNIERARSFSIESNFSTPQVSCQILCYFGHSLCYSGMEIWAVLIISAYWNYVIDSIISLATEGANLQIRLCNIFSLRAMKNPCPKNDSKPDFLQ